MRDRVPMGRGKRQSNHAANIVTAHRIGFEA
jgi:hypothetical protein